MAWDDICLLPRLREISLAVRVVQDMQKDSAFSLRSQTGGPSGPCALDEINAESFLNTEWVLTTSSGAGFVQFEQVMELTLVVE